MTVKQPKCQYCDLSLVPENSKVTVKENQHSLYCKTCGGFVKNLNKTERRLWQMLDDPVEKQYAHVLDLIEKWLDYGAKHGPGAVHITEIPGGAFLVTFPKKNK